MNKDEVKAEIERTEMVIGSLECEMALARDQKEKALKLIYELEDRLYQRRQWLEALKQRLKF